MDKRDLYIKAKLQEDKQISNQANEIFQNFEGGIKLENNNKQKEKRIFKLSLNQAVLAFTSLVIVFILGGNLYAHLNGKPNIYSAIKGLFVKEEKYTASEIIVDKSVESNGIKLTLKTVAMDENVLITKYIAEGEKLAEFYTYQDIEEAEIKANKIRLVLAGHDIGEKGYENYTLKDITKMRQDIVAKLQAVGLTQEEAVELEKIASEAYQEYIEAQLGLEGRTDAKAKELITQTIAMFESKVSSKYQIIQSSDTLQEFRINAISQKIEKNENQYIIYNVYNVDTITDLASKFNLSINVAQIGSTKGVWSFSTELEKARLDTRVETIDFYENNICKNVAPSVTTSDNVRHMAVVEAKRLVISDFSTVLMIQTRVSEEDREAYIGEYAENGLPCVYVVTDEEGNVLGTGTASKGTFEVALMSGGEIKYTERLILENVDKDTKKIYIKIYEQWDMSEYGDKELFKTESGVIELDIETARNSKKPVELTQSYASKNVQVAFKYPGDWTIAEENNNIIIKGPEDIDGNYVSISMASDTEDVANPGLNSKEIIEGLYNTYTELGEECQKGEVKIAGTTGYYFSHYFYSNNDGKSKTVCVDYNEKQITIVYSGELTQYERYEETFNKILETIEFVEPEKSYRTFSSDNGNEIVKVYEDNTLTISFSKDSIISLKGVLVNPELEANFEYPITGVPADVETIYSVRIMRIADDHYTIPAVYIVGISGKSDNLYCINRDKVLQEGKFEVKDTPIIEDIRVLSLDFATSEMYDFYEDKFGYTGSAILHCAEKINGTKYIIRNGTVVEYIPPVVPEENEPENNNQQEITDAKAKAVIQKYLSIMRKI